MTRTEAERELDSAGRDLSAALARYKELNEELEAAEQWVSAAIEREEAARKAWDEFPFQAAITSTAGHRKDEP